MSTPIQGGGEDFRVPKDRSLAKTHHQINAYVPVSDFRVLRRAAAERGIPVRRLVLELIEPGLDQLRRQHPDPLQDAG